MNTFLLISLIRLTDKGLFEKTRLCDKISTFALRYNILMYYFVLLYFECHTPFFHLIMTSITIADCLIQVKLCKIMNVEISHT